MKKLKILVLSDYAFTKGGAEKVAILSACGLVDRGNEVVFFSAVGPIDKDLKNKQFKEIICLNQKDILDEPNKLKSVFFGTYNFNAVRNLKQLFSRWQPDIVHLHGLSKALSWAVINTVFSYKIPIVYTLHDYGLVCPNLGIYDFRRAKVCQYYKRGYGFKCLVTNCDKRNYIQKLWRWQRFFISRHIFKINKKISGYIAVSNFIKELIQSNIKITTTIKVIYNPVQKFNNGNADIRQSFLKEKVAFLFVGRLSAEKGIDLLLEAISKVDATLYIIGDGELMGKCLEESKKSVKNKINVLGYREKDTIEDYMQKSDFLVLPSKCMEPAPLVIGEAASNFLPSIVANHGGLKEFVDDGINGYYFIAGNVESMVKVMNKIIANPALSIMLGKNAKDIIKKFNFDTGSHLDQLEKYYLDIITK